MTQVFTQSYSIRYWHSTEKFLHNIIKQKKSLPILWRVRPLATDCHVRMGRAKRNWFPITTNCVCLGFSPPDGFDNDHTFGPGATRLPLFFTEEPLPSHIISTRVDTVGTTYIRPFSPANGLYPSTEPFVGFRRAYRASGLWPPHNHQYAFQYP